VFVSSHNIPYIDHTDIADSGSQPNVELSFFQANAVVFLLSMCQWSVIFAINQDMLIWTVMSGYQQHLHEPLLARTTTPRLACKLPTLFMVSHHLILTQIATLSLFNLRVYFELPAAFCPIFTLNSFFEQSKLLLILEPYFVLCWVPFTRSLSSLVLLSRHPWFK
jgi:hypothetical protein